LSLSFQVQIFIVFVSHPLDSRAFVRTKETASEQPKDHSWLTSKTEEENFKIIGPIRPELHGAHL